MKKLLVTLLASALCVIGAKAQDATTQVATLSHDGALKAYYGQNSLKKAYEAAENGDIITLSAGTFPCYASIAKNITIRGVGGWADGNTDNNVTYISGGSEITLQDSNYELTIEGVRFSNDVYISSSFYKECTFSKVNFGSRCFKASENVYAKLIHCVTTSFFQLFQGICTNCVLNDFNAKSGTNAITLQNCVIYSYGETTWTNYNTFSRSLFNEDVLTNCIFISDGEYQLASNNTVHNCVYFNTSIKDYNFFANVTNTTNKIVEDRVHFFKNPNIVKMSKDTEGEISAYTVDFEDLRMDGTGLFELSDDAKKIYLGNDGTVVGVWGGTRPFNMTPSNPRVKKFDIVPRVDEDGKLKVTIEVEQ